LMKGAKPPSMVGSQALVFRQRPTRLQILRWSRWVAAAPPPTWAAWVHSLAVANAFERSFASPRRPPAHVAAQVALGRPLQNGTLTVGGGDRRRLPLLPLLLLRLLVLPLTLKRPGSRPRAAEDRCDRWEVSIDPFVYPLSMHIHRESKLSMQCTSRSPCRAFPAGCRAHAM